MGWVIELVKSSIGAKVVMALTGVVLVGFVFAHMAGNLQIYLGRDAFNTYSYFMQSKRGLVWSLRLGLLAMVLLHIVSALRLAALNRAARGPVGYRQRNYREAKLSGRTMVLSGVMLATFIVYHLLHFTAGVTNPDDFARTETLASGLTRHDAYSMFVLGFQKPAISGVYIVAMVLLGMHLSHGVASMFQSLGLTSPRWRPFIDKLGPTLAAAVVLGNISMPIAVLAGALTL